MKYEENNSKGFDLRLDGESGASEDGVIVRIGIERRIETYQVDAAVGEVSHDVEAVAVVEGVGCKADVHSINLFHINHI